MALGRKPIEIVNNGKHQLLVKAECWERIYLEEIAKVQNGFAFSSKNFVKSGGMPLIRIRDINKSSTVDRYNGVFSGDFIVKKGDVLIGMDGDFKAAIWKGEDALLNQRVCRIIPNSKNYDPKFLFLCLQPYLNAINEETSSVTVKHLSSRTIEEIPLPYPKLQEQQAIVSKIEELFSELDKGIENLRLAQQQLKTYRQAVLKWAFEGKLTNENIKEGELPKGWKWSNLKELKQFSLYGPRFSSKDYTENGIAILRTTDISERGKVDWINSPKLNLSDAEYEKYKLIKNDLLITRTGSIGRLSIFNDDKKAIPGAFLIHYRLVENLNIWYIFHFLKSQKAQKHFSEHSFGVGRPNLNVPNIELLQIPLPPTEEQHKITQEIESRLSIADKMEESINQSLQQAETLRQSILKKAFEGRLVQEEAETVANQSTRIIPFDRKVLAGKIIHLMHEEKYFGLTKFQKMLYLVENFAQVEYDTNFIQERAGPYDKDFTQAFRQEMQDNDWFSEEQKGIITKFIPSENVGALISEYARYFRSKGPRIVFVIQQLQDKSSHDAELIATLYAVWNNRLIKKKPVKEKELVEDFFNWSAKKKEEFQEEEVIATYKWMKKVKLTPVGFGKVIG